jgi:hypothetical protein
MLRQPLESRRELEQLPREREVGEPQQRHPGEPQQEQRSPPLQCILWPDRAEALRALRQRDAQARIPCRGASRHGRIQREATCSAARGARYLARGAKEAGVPR